MATNETNLINVCLLKQYVITYKIGFELYKMPCEDSYYRYQYYVPKRRHYFDKTCERLQYEEYKRRKNQLKAPTILRIGFSQAVITGLAFILCFVMSSLFFEISDALYQFWTGKDLLEAHLTWMKAHPTHFIAQIITAFKNLLSNLGVTFLVFTGLVVKDYLLVKAIRSLKRYEF